ncbi:uncharacterized protein Z518_09360 [Rhinocladiella mackenziei CBS 650.93]|uniref:D-isomer specific 2-hydroxyacid dehydrogenase NAD-binding domain-containing protein n=1 Tax=Rhinocladiella mackenziei CBS 650.93 TaxID=1442369 RepID=A0A0D2I730_9EURO|nr:uncharacterized protein Z518_09360 [Rhinocladiella mackenziei CBS 650.93]KIX01634.1 hypothetical protein Z518_09360 [Rhinocladiella mackenziei CBS 650.93]
MGGGPDKEHLLITMWEPEPKHITAELKRRFPYFDITYIPVQRKERQLSDSGRDVPDELWNSATILITLATLPSTPEKVPNLKLIHLLSAGVDHILNHPVLTSSTIPVTTSSGIHGPPITEWVTMTALIASRHYWTEYEWQKQRHWETDRKKLVSGTDWVGKTVGIAGYGSIGRQVARVFSALGSSIHAYTASPRDTPSARADHGYFLPGTGDPDGTIPSAWYSGTSKTALHTFLASGLDMLVIALPLTPATRGMFGTAEFEIVAHSSNKPRKGKGCFLVNIARGGLLDQSALVKALNDETLLGAALDVTDPEPLPEDDPLWDAKNVIITPHVSALGSEYSERAYDLFMTNWTRHEEGKKMFNLVDRRKGY